MNRLTQKGFTLIELLVVIAIIALLLSIIVPSLQKVKMSAQKIVCRSNIRQLCMGILLYADVNNNEIPVNTDGQWFWDLSVWSSNRIIDAALLVPDVFFCPAERFKKPGDARFWQFSRCPSGSLSPVSLMDESELTLQEQYSHYRVLTYIFLIDKIEMNPDSPNYGNSLWPSGGLLTDPDYKWLRYVYRVKNASTHEMVADTVIQSGGTPSRFEQLQGGSYNKYGIYDMTSNLKRQTFGPGAESAGRMPDGGNMGFVDGHVEWRPKENMNWQITYGRRFWW